MVSIKKIQFIGLMPNIIECCSFVPDKYKSHNVFINRILHKIGTLGILAALFMCTSSPDISAGLVAGSFGTHVVGHFLEGFFN
jgi:hypothetical protein